MVESTILTFSHVRPNGRGPAGSVPVFLLAGELAQVPGAVAALGVVGGEEALLQPELEANAPLAIPLLANLCPFVALGLVILFVFRLGALCVFAIAEGGSGAFVVTLALPVHGPGDELAVLVAAGPLTRRALVLRAPSVVAVHWFECTALHFVLAVCHIFGHTGVATLLSTLIFIKPTITFFSLLHDLISTKGSVGLFEAV